MTGGMRGVSRSLLRVSMVVTGLLIALLHPLGAQAHWGNCLDDPKIWLSDGTKLDLVTTIGAPQGEVLSVNYVLHVAPGVTVDHVVDTRNNRPYVETLTVLNDAAAGHVSTETTVLMLAPGGTTVQAAASINQGASGSTLGTDGQDLLILL